MARNDGRLEKGQRLSGAISARAWNRAQDAADRVLGTRPGFAADGPGGTSAPYTWVYARNASGAAVNRWGVLAITGVEITPTTSSGGATAEFEAMPVLTASAISGNETKERCVAIEPLAANAVGMVAIAGAVQVKAADLDKVVGGRTLWKNSNWALVQLGGSRVRLCKTTAAWAVDATATLQVWHNGTPPSESQTTGETVVAVNKMYPVASGVFVIVAQAENGYWYLVEAAQETVRLGTISATWEKGSDATVTQIKGDGSAISPTVTFTAKNWFAPVTVSSGTKKVSCALVDETWILIAAEC